jgi:hypothetical protein
MAILPRELIDIGQIHLLNLSGRGGKESIIGSLLPERLGWSRCKEPNDKRLADYINRNGLSVEVKKQDNAQWFDVGKYYNLSDADREIIMLFVNHFKGSVIELAAIRLGGFLGCSSI